MPNHFRIVIDTFGPDAGPIEVIKGADELLKKHPEVVLTLVGNEQLIKENIQDLARVKIIPTDNYISNTENIMEAFMNKKDASIILAAQETKAQEDAIGMLSAGNSGALLVSCLKFLASPDLTRPCIAAVLPAENGTYTCLVDTGANIDCTPSQLHQFALLGSKFMRELYGIESPKVGLLSNGVESTKGNKLVKETYPILEAEEKINFVGNIEGNRALSGDCDVLVADGFSANQVLKVTEGTAARIIKDIFIYSKKTNRPEFTEVAAHLMKIYDLSSLGGGVVLGIAKPVIKCRGNSKAITFVNTAEMLINIANNKTLFEGKDNDRS